MMRLCDAKHLQIVIMQHRMFKVYRKETSIVLRMMYTEEGRLKVRSGHKLTYGLKCKMWVNKYQEPETIKEAKVVEMMTRPEAVYNNSGHINLIKKLAK